MDFDLHDFILFITMQKVEAAPYGIKAVRQIKETNQGKQVENENRTRKMNATYDYFLEKVDPVIGACITKLLIDQPDPTLVPEHIIDFLNTAGPDMKIESAPNQKRTSKRPRKEMKLYLATSIAPVITKLVNRIALDQPADVRGYMQAELRNMVAGVADQSLPQAPSDAQQQAKTGPPTGSKSNHQSPRAVDEVDCVENKQQQKEESVSVSASSKVQQVELQAQPPAPEPVLASSEPPQERSIQLAVVGLGGVGKSSIINRLQGKFEKPRATIGFRPVSMMLSEDIKVRFYDLGGGKKIRDIWAQYYHDIHGLVFVVDGSAKRDEMQETAEVMTKCLESTSFLAGKPLLIIANKQDVPEAIIAEEWKEYLQSTSLASMPPQQVVIYSNTTAAVPAEGEEKVADPRIEAALEQLLEVVISRFDELNERVIEDIKLKAIEEARRRIERERNVLRKKIATAFISEVDPAYIAEQQIEAEPERIFDVDEGVAFIAAEIGEEVANLPQEAIEVAAMVGYHQLAMQIVGGLRAPVSKKKTPLNWPEIHSMVKELRAELNLPPI